MAFGIYVHIPYCLQRCPYCDFATYEHDKIAAPLEYVNSLCREIRNRSGHLAPRNLDTLYFGGGTPSLLEPELLGRIVRQIQDVGFKYLPETEVTLEINPATLDSGKIEAYQKLGFNRFSVGAQSFSDTHLKRLGRKHSAQDTRDTLELLRGAQVNYSADLLFALPHQTLSELSSDIDEFLRFSPDHISPYCLTVPSSNPLSVNRPMDDVQVQMFNLIRDRLTSGGYERYEISNFSKPGRHSRHNWLYWNDDEYWGIGLSAHSYLKQGPWGLRFWNTKSIENYFEQMRSEVPYEWPQLGIPEAQLENLKEHEALTDFCHTALRTTRGLSRERLKNRFGKRLNIVEDRLQALKNKGLVDSFEDFWVLTDNGLLLSNSVFESLLFVQEDLVGKQ